MNLLSNKSPLYICHLHFIILYQREAISQNPLIGLDSSISSYNPQRPPWQVLPHTLNIFYRLIQCIFLSAGESHPCSGPLVGS